MSSGGVTMTCQHRKELGHVFETCHRPHRTGSRRNGNRSISLNTPFQQLYFIAKCWQDTADIWKHHHEQRGRCYRQNSVLAITRFAIRGVRARIACRHSRSSVPRKHVSVTVRPIRACTDQISVVGWLMRRGSR